MCRPSVRLLLHLLLLLLLLLGWLFSGSAAAFVPESWLLLVRRRAAGSKSQHTQKPRHNNNIKYVDQKLLQMGFDVSATQSSALVAGFASGIPGFVTSLLLLLLLLLDSLPLLFPPHLLGASTPKFFNAYYPPTPGLLVSISSTLCPPHSPWYVGWPLPPSPAKFCSRARNCFRNFFCLQPRW